MIKVICHFYHKSSLSMFSILSSLKDSPIPKKILMGFIVILVREQLKPKPSIKYYLFSSKLKLPL